jgi:hydrogenase maturation protease
MSGRILVAGIGNIFLADDGFGCEVVRRLAGRELPDKVEGRDFGIRGIDLAYALTDPYEAVVFVDAVPRGEEPGTVYLIEAEVPEEGEVALDTHSMDPVKVIRLARVLGAEIPRTLVVGCEPKVVFSGEHYDDMLMQLSEPVQKAVDEAVKMVESVVEEINAQTTSEYLKPDARCKRRGDREEVAVSGPVGGRCRDVHAEQAGPHEVSEYKEHVGVVERDLTP